jgi:hypothetical protein
MKLLILQFSPTSSHFIPLRSKYSPQHPVLHHLHDLMLNYLSTDTALPSDDTCVHVRSICPQMKFVSGSAIRLALVLTVRRAGQVQEAIVTVGDGLVGGRGRRQVRLRTGGATG